MGTHYLIVTPRRRWYSQRPAVHLCEEGSGYTLCGKLADGWLVDNWAGTFRPELANCLTCKRIYERKERETMDQNEKPVKHAIAGENMRAAPDALDLENAILWMIQYMHIHEPDMLHRMFERAVRECYAVNTSLVTEGALRAMLQVARDNAYLWPDEWDQLIDTYGPPEDDAE